MQTHSSLCTSDRVCNRRVYHSTVKERGKGRPLHTFQKVSVSPAFSSRASQQVLNCSRTTQLLAGTSPSKSVGPGFDYWCRHLGAVWPWTSCITSLSLNFLISETVYWIPLFEMDRVLEGKSVWCFFNLSKAFVEKLAWKHRAFFREPRVSSWVQLEWKVNKGFLERLQASSMWPAVSGWLEHHPNKDNKSQPLEVLRRKVVCSAERLTSIQKKKKIQAWDNLLYDHTI